MRIGVLGTGQVGQAIGRRLATLGHDVMMGGRGPGDAKAGAFAAETGGRAGSYAEAAAFGDMVFHCTRGNTALDVLAAIGQGPLAGKVLVDVANPLDFSHGFPPILSISNTDSLGEAIQRLLPDTRVVKTLNTVNAAIMIDPGQLAGPHAVFVSGNDMPAKGQVMDVLRSFGWQSIIDLGDISTARGTEQMLPLWTRLYEVLGTGSFNFVLTKA